MSATYVCIGDSLTHAPWLGVKGSFVEPESLLPQHEYPYRIRRILAEQGYGGVWERNLGIGGNTSAQMLGRKEAITLLGPPTVLSIYAGANDPAFTAEIDNSDATATVLPLAADAGKAFAAGSFAIVAGESREISSVDDDTLTLAAPLSAVPKVGEAVAIDTQANIVALGAFAMAAGCSRILVGGMHYKNWVKGGDTLTVQEPVYAALRTAQRAAVAALQARHIEALYSDRYTFMRNLIMAGAETQGSNSGHSPKNNQHLSRHGHEIIARSDVSALATKPLWLEALSR